MSGAGYISTREDREFERTRQTLRAMRLTDRDRLLDQLASDVSALPQPVLGLKGGVDRRAVLDAIERLRR